MVHVDDNLTTLICFDNGLVSTPYQAITWSTSKEASYVYVQL